MGFGFEFSTITEKIENKKFGSKMVKKLNLKENFSLKQ